MQKRYGTIFVRARTKIKMLLRKLSAFIKRDLLIEVSYGFSFFLTILRILSYILVFFFIARLLGKGATPYLKPYNGDYFSFVLLGIAFHGYLSAGLHTFSRVIREGQMTGTLEAMLVTPTNIHTILLLSSIWSFLYTSAEVLVYILIGFLLGIDFSQANITSFLVMLILTVIAFSSLGIVSAGFILLFKRGDPVAMAIGGLSGLFGGVYYPISILPDWLRIFSYILPITYSLHGMRNALLNGSPIGEIMEDIVALLIFIAIILPVGIISFRYAIKRAKTDGSLLQY